MENDGKEAVVAYLRELSLYFKDVLGKSTVKQSGYSIFEKFQTPSRNTNQHMESLMSIMEQVRQETEVF
jgi:hypothetical protein